MADSSKTEQATPRRREKAREKGQIARSRELPAVFAMAGVAGVLAMMSAGAVTHWTTLYRNTLDLAATTDLQSNGPVMFWSVVEVFRWIVPVLSAAMLLSLAAGLAQGGLNIAPEALALKFERFSPAAKMGQIFSPVGLSNILKSLLPFSAILWVSVHCIQSHWEQIVLSSQLGVRDLAAFVGGMVFEVGWKAGVILLVWSAVDYLLTWQKQEGDLKMTRQEIKEESKETDGNPAIKQRIRQLQRRMRRTQSLKAAETATVVVTNPTHYAVALRYEADMAAPIVVAKGRDLLAEKIKAMARDKGIMLMENRPLAQALYKSVEVGDVIPAKLYQAVAEILVVVFRAQEEVRKQEARRRSRNASGEPVAAGSSAGSGGAQPGVRGPDASGAGSSRSVTDRPVLAQTISGRTISGQTSSQTISGPTISGRAIPGPAITGSAISGAAMTGSAIPGAAITGSAISGQTITGQPSSLTTPDQTIPDQTDSGQTIADQTIAGQTEHAPEQGSVVNELGTSSNQGVEK